VTSGKLAFGDLVVCADGEHARAFSLGGQAGIVVETRKSDARVLYLPSGRSAWLPLSSLTPAPAGETAGTSLALAAELVRALGGHALEASSVAGSPEGLRLVISHGAVTVNYLGDLRVRFEGSLRGWSLRPGGMHRMESVIEIEPGNLLTESP
jgi:hypothetical protein